MVMKHDLDSMHIYDNQSFSCNRESEQGWLKQLSVELCLRIFTDIFLSCKTEGEHLYVHLDIMYNIYWSKLIRLHCLLSNFVNNILCMCWGWVSTSTTSTFGSVSVNMMWIMLSSCGGHFERGGIQKLYSSVVHDIFCWHCKKTHTYICITMLIKTFYLLLLTSGA